MLSTKQKESLGFLFPFANSLRLYWLKIKYRGNKVHCVCCDSHFREFAPFGVTKRKNAWCPNCKCLERDRMLWTYLDQKTDLYTVPKKLLHIAPETVFFEYFTQHARIDYFPADISPNLYPKGTAYFDILNNSNADNTYDVIICNHVFQYIIDDRKAMSEIYRIMKRGGWGIVQVPIDQKLEKTYEDYSITDPKEREKAFGLKEHVRFYAKDYADRLQEVGFKVTVDDFTATLTDEEIFANGFRRGLAIYKVEKK